MLIQEIKDNNKESGKTFDVAQSLVYQIPHFACINFFLKDEYQKDVAKYSLSKNHNIPAHSGCYGDQPLRWVKKLFLIESAIQKLQEREQAKAQAKVKG